jgi:2'-5' RNA ligase
MGVPGVRRMSHDSPLFLPHLSVAQYRSTRDYERLIGHLEAVRETWAGDLSVENIHLAIAHLPVRGIYPRLETVAEFRL